MPATSSLRRCDGQRTAVVLECVDEDRVIAGYATTEEDPTLGCVLRISVDGGECGEELLIQESTWHGEIVDGAEHGCTFCLVPLPRTS